MRLPVEIQNLKAAESGNLEDFNRYYSADPVRLAAKDAKGRTCAHYAASRDKVNILQFIKNHNGNLNVQDNCGNTPLHLAVQYESLQAIEFLLENEVDTAVQNNKKQAALHLATEGNKVNALKAMSVYKHKFNPHQGAEHGRTALHLAAIYDYPECAYILINEFGANTRHLCNNGYYPMHEAAKNASSRVMQVLLQWGEGGDGSGDSSNSQQQMMSFFDAEGNVPLHSAVHSGDIKAVELCLKSGSKISTQQRDMSTAVHLACSQGSIDIVKLMFSLQPEEKIRCLALCDAQKMTPLHCAAMFDRFDIVQYLIEEGADMNALDKENRPALLLAASRSCWKTVKKLVEMGADIQLKDSNQRNVLHFIVARGGDIEEFAESVKNIERFDDFEKLLNEKDKRGCTPMHYACQGGYIKSLESLMKYGACVNLKNNENETPLHLAAWNGRINTLKKLLDSERGTFIINEANGEGLTPLHISSKRGHTSAVQLLLNKGALLHRDHNGRNPLHLAAMAGCTHTMELLHSVHSHLLDQTDKDKNTALHLATLENKPFAIALLLSLNCKLLSNSQNLSAIDYAIYYKYAEATLAMVTHDTRGAEVMALKSDKHPCVTLALIASMPRVFEAVQDKCITKANCKKDSKLFYVKYNFSCLQCSPEREDGIGTGTSTSIGGVSAAAAVSETLTEAANPLPVLNAMVQHGRVELLAHPLSQKYLEMKWNAYGKYFHLVHLLLYSVFLVFVTFFSLNLVDYQPPLLLFHRNTSSSSLNSTITITTAPTGSVAELSFKQMERHNSGWMLTAAVCVLTYVLCSIMRESVQLCQHTWAYMTDPTNFVYFLLYVTAILMVFPTLFGPFDSLQISCASITVFLSWFTLLLTLRRFDHIGIYVVMFLEILQTLIKVLLVFSILIVAFGLAFYLLLSKGNHLAFSTVPMSVMRTFAMMLGEIDFLGTYVYPFYNVNTIDDDDDDGDNGSKLIPYPVPLFIVLCLFMVFMPILLMNLLIGLAVGDIESVKRNAQLKRLAMQVLLHSELERKLPHKLLQKIDKKELIEYPNERKSKLGLLDFFFRIWFRHNLSEEGIEQVLERKEEEERTEMDLMKIRMTKIYDTMERQRLLLKLITEKMGIRTECDDIDEGVTFDNWEHTIVANGSKHLYSSSSSSSTSSSSSSSYRYKVRYMGQSFNRSFT